MKAHFPYGWNPRRWKEKGSQSLSLLFYAGFSLPEHLRECLLNWASHQREKSTLWILIGLGQIFCEVKFKIAADLSIKIKKITRNVFWGQFFFSLLNFQSNYLAVPSTIIISISQDFFFPQGDTSTSFHGKGRDVLCNLTQFWSIWDKDSSRDLVIMGFLLSIRCYGCPSSPLQTYL